MAVRIERLLQRFDRRLRKIERHMANIPVRWAGGSTTKTFLAKITGSASLSTNRWKYAWTEVTMSGDDVTDKTNGRSGTTSDGYAINLAEINHTSTYAFGIDTTSSDYPNFEPRPIGGAGTDNTHKYDVIVEMTARPDGSGGVKYTFYSMGSHDGTCS